jgi:ABC-type amino acid transport substrate-binding protein
MKNQIARIVKAAALIAACGLAGLAAPKQVVTVGTEGVYAPFTFLDGASTSRSSSCPRPGTACSWPWTPGSST